MEDLLAKIGLKGAHLLTGLIAGVMGLVFNKRLTTIREKIRAYTIVLSGAILTGYITPLVLLKWEFLIGAEYSVAFVVGLFGMGLIEAIFNFIGRLKADPLGVGKAIKDIFSRN